MGVRTSESFSYIRTSVVSLTLCLMNMNQYASIKTTDPIILFLSSFFEINQFLESYL